MAEWHAGWRPLWRVKQCPGMACELVRQGLYLGALPPAMPHAVVGNGKSEPQLNRRTV
jgi:hypothetical protein